MIGDCKSGEDFVELVMSGTWSNISGGLMFTADSGDQIMLLQGIDRLEQVTFR